MHEFFKCLGALAVLLASGSSAARGGEAKTNTPAGEAEADLNRARCLSYVLPAYATLQAPAVQQQLALTAEQREKLRELGRKYGAPIEQQQVVERADWASIDKLKREEQHRAFAELQTRQKERRDRLQQWADEARKELELLLQPRQLEHLSEIAFRQQAATLYYTPELLDQLHLTAEQKQQLAKIREGTQRKLSEQSQKFYQVNTDAAAQAMALLKPEQVEKLKTLVVQAYRKALLDGLRNRN